MKLYRVSWNDANAGDASAWYTSRREAEKGRTEVRNNALEEGDDDVDIDVVHVQPTLTGIANALNKWAFNQDGGDTFRPSNLPRSRR